MALTKKEVQDKDLKAILQKDLGANNPVFSAGHLEELHKVFSLYCDSRVRKTEIRDILFTANTIGLSDKFGLAMKILDEVDEANQGKALDFETFVRQLTHKIGGPFSEEGRRATFDLMDYEGKGEITLKDMKEINDSLNYGFSELELLDIIHAVGGYNSEAITFDKFNLHVKRRLARRKRELLEAGL